jgi:hypothetical protein
MGFRATVLHVVEKFLPISRIRDSILVGKRPNRDGNLTLAIAEGAILVNFSVDTPLVLVNPPMVNRLGVNLSRAFTGGAMDVVVFRCCFHASIVASPTGSARKICRKWVANCEGMPHTTGMENNNPPPISTEEWRRNTRKEWKEYQRWVHGKAGLLDPEEQKKFDEEFPGVSKPIKFIEMSADSEEDE